ncbi:hypothetical protein F4860DRAFT_464583 [Xylaria cubensis]|nr:hypothetical protein F4860DRAFT_464583 [Xylaria cubensis]
MIRSTICTEAYLRQKTRQLLPRQDNGLPKSKLNWRTSRCHVYLRDQLAGRISLLSMPQTGIAYDELSLSRATRCLDVYHNEFEGIETRLINDLHVKVTMVCSHVRVIKPSGSAMPHSSATRAYRDPVPCISIHCLAANTVISDEQGSTMLSLRDTPSLHINVIGEGVTPPSSEFEFPSYSNRTTATVVIVPTLHVLPADVDDHARPNVSIGRAQTT